MTLDEIAKRLDKRHEGMTLPEGRKLASALDEHRKNAMTIAEALRAAQLSARLLAPNGGLLRSLVDDLIRLLQPYADGEAERLAAVVEDERQYRVDNLVQAIVACVYTDDNADDPSPMRADYLDTIYRDADAVMDARERYIAARAKR